MMRSSSPSIASGANGMSSGTASPAAIDVAVTQHQQHALLRTAHEADFRLQREHARAFAAHQRARHVEAVFRQQLIEVIARHAALDLRKTRAYQFRVSVAQRLQSGVDFAAPAAAQDDLREFGIGGRADPHAHAVVRQDFQRLDVLDRLAGHYRVRAARVVADHAAQRAAAVGGRIGAEGQAVLLRAHRAAHRTRRPARRGRSDCDASMSSTRLRYFEVSITTATLTHWPFCEVPPPRIRIGASCRRQISSAATISSTSLGTTTPIGTWR